MSTNVLGASRDADYGSNIIYDDGSGYQNVEVSVETPPPNTNYVDVKQKKKDVEPLWRSMIKVFLILVLFLAFVGVVVLIVELIEADHNKQVFTLNIHIKLGQSCADEAIRINRLITSYDPQQQIDLVATSEPHLTMYLTTFYIRHEKDIYKSLNQTLSNYKYDCLLQTNPRLNPPTLTNTYALWDTNNPSCLQELSDRIVNATYPYIDERAKMQAPSWIDELPEPIKSLKKKMIKDFGSPNVFSQFQPHITVAHDDIDRDVMNTVLKGSVSATNNCTIQIRQVSVGSVGNYGTVMRGKDKWSFLFDF
ncbi:hypothetical protein AKO1_006205 [Acrasis kona]|uniref:Uncharacterized protein n=1 Tax=Acrasis kona TaxID=1008807 RepID=A0AAW2YHD2_9EUKA